MRYRKGIGIGVWRPGAVRGFGENFGRLVADAHSFRTGIRESQQGESMVIRPLVAANVSGEFGRPAGARGKSGGSAAFYPVGDSVTLGGSRAGANLYSASPLFKMMGSVQLTSDD